MSKVVLLEKGHQGFVGEVVASASSRVIEEASGGARWDLNIRMVISRERVIPHDFPGQVRFEIRIAERHRNIVHRGNEVTWT